MNMDQLTLISAFKEMLLVTMLTICLITLPTLIVGVLVSVLQAATQINEMTITFVPKIIVMFVVLMTMMPWLMGKLIALTHGFMANIPSYIR
jgi:flagellar biosynthesis protein FliQ